MKVKSLNVLCSKAALQHSPKQLGKKRKLVLRDPSFPNLFFFTTDLQSSLCTILTGCPLLIGDSENFGFKKVVNNIFLGGSLGFWKPSF